MELDKEDTMDKYFSVPVGDEQLEDSEGIEVEGKKRDKFVDVSVPVLALPGKLTYGFKPYMVTCFLCGKTEGVAIWTRSSAINSFIANGWKWIIKQKHWLCPKCN